MPRWSNQFRTAVLDPTSSAYRQGYHKGNTGGLPGVDADLAPANIKDGVTIFGKLGTLAPGVDVSDADAAVGDVKDPKTFYSVAPPRKTGTMPTVAITAANSNYPAGYHAGNVGGLEAIDTDLAPANIKSGVTIFGFLGTFDRTLLEDFATTGVAGTDAGSAVGNNATESIAANSDSVSAYASITPTFTAGTLAFAVAIAKGNAAVADLLTLRIYMGGVLEGETGYISTTEDMTIITGFAALSGSKTIIAAIHNYHATLARLWLTGSRTTPTQYGVGVVVGNVGMT